MDGFVQNRMTVIWCNFIQRFQHKITVFHINMRNMEIRCIDDFIVIKQNIQIEGTRPPVDDTLSVGCRFQFMKTVKQLFRSQKRAETKYTIEELILFYTSIWLCDKIF